MSSAYEQMKDMYWFASVVSESMPGKDALLKTMGAKRRKKRLDILSVLNPKHKANVRAAMKKISDPLLFPLTKESRCYYPHDDYEGYVEYGIMEDKGYSYEELKEFFDDQYVTTGCDYSPSGRLFTRYIHWKRTPIGIAYVIYWGLDV